MEGDTNSNDDNDGDAYDADDEVNYTDDDYFCLAIMMIMLQGQRGGLMKGDTDSHLEICKRSPSGQTRCKKREIAKNIETKLQLNPIPRILES